MDAGLCQVRHVDGRIHLVTGCAPAAPWCQTDVPGGWVRFDPLRPQHLCELVVDAGGQTQMSIERELSLRPGALAHESARHVRLGTSWAPVARLAQVMWLHRWSPYATDGERDDLDVARALSEAGYSYRALQRFDSASTYLSELLRWAADRALPASLNDVITGIGNCALDVLGARHPRYGDIQRGLQDVADAPNPEALEPGRRLTGAGRELASFLRHAGDETNQAFTVPLAGALYSIATVEPKDAWAHEDLDWWCVPPSIANAFPEGFRWQLSGKHNVVEVELPTVPDPSHQPTLVARVGTQASGEILAEAPLISSSPNRLSARVTLRHKMPSKIAVDIAVLAVDLPIATGYRKQRRTAERKVIRSVTLARLAVVADLFEAGAGDAFRDMASDKARDAVSEWPRRRRPDREGTDARIRDQLETFAHQLDAPSSVTSSPTALDVPAFDSSAPTLAEMLLVADQRGLAPP